MKERITQTLKQNRGYHKWGRTRLAEKFGCSEKTITSCITALKEKGLWYSNYATV